MEVGAVVGDRFVIEATAGAGGMGVVLRARDRTTNEAVALKVLRERDEASVRRFVREARVLSALDHPGVVRYVAHGAEKHDGLVDAWMAMEWLEGETLAQRLSRGRLTGGETIVLLSRVADALAFAHTQGVVHRDIKPANLFLPGGALDRVKILDFGVARPRLDVEMTTPGALVGTPSYMSPEQARGVIKVAPSADVFSLGCVVFRCLTGRKPFDAKELVGMLLKIVLEEAPSPSEIIPEVPPALDRLVVRMMSKDPRRRPQDGAAVVAALSSIDESASSRVRPGRASSASMATSLGSAEQQIASVIVAGSRSLLHDDDEPRTMSARRVARLRAAVVPFDAQLEFREGPSGRGPNVEGREGPSGRGPNVEEREGPSGRGPNVEVLRDGSLVVAFRGRASVADQAQRAARCALMLRKHFPRAAMVVATGRRFAEERVPVGEVIDRAARLLRSAMDRDVESPEKSRGIALDEVTAGLLDLRFDVRGDASGLELFGEREIVEATRTLLGKHTPCVGRDRELDALEGMLAQCIEEPMAKVALVTGSAGVGKSRLRWELLQRVKRRTDVDVQVWLTRGDAMRVGSAFAMIGPALRRSAGILDGEPAATQRQKLAARVARHVTTDVARITEFLSQLAGVDVGDAPSPAPGAQSGGAMGAVGPSAQLQAARRDPMLMSDQIRRAFEDFLAAECRAGPFLLVLEDLHWGDVPSVKLVDSMLRLLHDKPLMVLALARAEVHEVFPDLWSERDVQQLRLGSLSKKSAEKLVRSALGETVDVDTVARIVERGGGNAFYLEELVRAVAQGRDEEFPPTVLAMVQARLEKLEPSVRRVLRAASVFGQVFWKGAVGALVGSEETAVTRAHIDGALDELVRREVTAARGEGVFPGEDEHIFRHAFYREAAYGMLTPEDRALGHRLAGAWLERAGEREAIVLADHFERGGEYVRAAEHFLRAAEQALAGNDLDGALARAERGIVCGARGQLRGALCVVLAEAHRWRGTLGDAGTLAKEALDLLPRGSKGWCAALGHLAAMHGEKGDARALELDAQIMCSFRPDDEARGALAIAVGRTSVYALNAGTKPLAERLLARMGELAADLHDPAVAALHLWSSAIHAAYAGDQGRFLSLTLESVRAFEEAGDLRGACAQRINVGNAYKELGMYEEGERVLREALSVARRYGLSMNVALALQNLGFVLAHRGALDEARVIESEAIVLFGKMASRRMEAVARIYFARMLAAAADLDHAMEHALVAIEMTRPFPAFHGYALGVVAHLDLLRGRPKEALDVARAAMGDVEAKSPLEEGESFVRSVHAEALAANGDGEGARRAIAVARARIEERTHELRDASLARSFLQNVPENARVMQLDRMWNGEGVRSARG